MEENQFSFEQFIEETKATLDHCIQELHQKIREYGSFTIIANSIARLFAKKEESGLIDQPTIPEYLALICLKFPFSLGNMEFINPRDTAKDLNDITELASKAYGKFSLLNQSRFRRFDKGGQVNDISAIAQMLSSYELMVRNPQFEDIHWDNLEGLYSDYDDYFKEKLGFTVKEAIRICLTIHEYMEESFIEAMMRCRREIKLKVDEAIAYKNRGKKPAEFYPDEMLESFKRTPDNYIRMEIEQSMMTYEMVIMGETLSFTAKEIADMEELDVETVNKLLACLSITFGEIHGDFAQPEIMHPLKDKPLIHHESKHICPSIPLLDYSLDRLFSKVVSEDKIKKDKYKDVRHDFLLETGIALLKRTLKAKEVYLNLDYPGGEMDGLIILDEFFFFVEAKAQLLTDKAKEGYMERIEKGVKDVVKGSYNQSIKAFNYLFGKKDAEFKDAKKKKILIDGSRAKHTYFISLTLEDFSTFSCNLKVNNSLDLFTSETFPWIVSLHDLQVVCDHMEGPSYFIQYLHRRRAFFAYNKFMIEDEINLLAYYLKRNLRFDGLIKDKYDHTNWIFLDNTTQEIDKYYSRLPTHVTKVPGRLKYSCKEAIKRLIQYLETSSLPFALDTAIQILEFSNDSKNNLLETIKKIKKQHNKDGKSHDFRIGGNDLNESTWMLSYWIGKNSPDLIYNFEHFVIHKFRENPVRKYTAILDVGKSDYEIIKIICLSETPDIGDT